MHLPHQLPVISSWQLFDYREEHATATAAAGGTATLSLTTVPDGQLWVYDRLVVQTTSALTVVCQIYDDPSLASIALIDGTNIPPSPSFVPGDNAAPYRLSGGKQLTAFFTGANVGDRCTLRAWCVVLRRHEMAG